MAKLTVKHATIIGAGLLGGSMGLSLKRRWPGVHVAGVGRRLASLYEAKDKGAIDSVHLDVAEAVPASDLVVLATPVGAIAGHLKAIRPHLRRGVLVTDVGSTKAQIVWSAAKVLGPDGPFVGSHPMAGSELKGASHARADLFDGAVCILTPTARTPAGLLRRARQLWTGLGCRLVEMTPAAHDVSLARVSHLPHALAVLLMLLPHERDVAVSGPGLRDMTRLAGGDAEIWRDIFMTNRRAMLSAIDRLDEGLLHLRDLLEVGEAQSLQGLLELARRRREQLLTNGRGGGES